MTESIKPRKNHTLHKVIRIGRWHFSPEIQSISNGSNDFSLSKSSSKLLLLLFQRTGYIVEKKQLIDQVWQDVLVSEDSLTKAISELRKIFAQDKSKSVQIVTVRGIGYKLLCVSNRPIVIKKSLGALGGLVILIFATLYVSGFFDPGARSSINITNNLGEQRGPRISPDGSRILYSSISAGWNNFDIHAHDIGEEQPISLVASDAVEMDPIWSPDGKTIVYVKQDHDKLRIVSNSLDDHLQESITTLQSGSGLSVLDWSAKRETIVFSDRVNHGPQAIFEIDPLDKTSRTKVTAPKPGIIGDHSPKISPDGSKMAFIRISRQFPFYQHLIPGEGEVFIKHKGEARQLTKLSSAISGISWVDKDHLVFSVAHDFLSFRIYKINIHSGEKKVVYESDHIIRNLDFNPSIQSLAFEEWDLDHKIWKVWRNERNLYMANPVFASEGNEWSPAISPDGSALAYITDRMGTSLMITNSEKVEKSNVRIDSGAIANLSWSSDGQKLLYEKLGFDSTFIYTYDKLKETSVLRATVPGRYAFPFWSEISDAIYFVGQDKTYKLFKFYLAGSTLELVNRDIRLSKGIFSKGQLLYSRSGYPGIWSKDSTGTKKVFSNLNSQDNFNWEVHEDMAYLITRDPFFQPTLSSFDLETKIQKSLFVLPNSVAVDFSGLSVNPGKDCFYVTMNVKKRSDIMLLKGL